MPQFHSPAPFVPAVTYCEMYHKRPCKPFWPLGCKAGKQKGIGSIPLRLSFLVKKVVVFGHSLVTLSLTINETFKWLSSLPIRGAALANTGLGGSSSVAPSRACLGARLLPRSYQYPNLSEGADRVDGQLRGDKECPFSGKSAPSVERVPLQWRN